MASLSNFRGQNCKECQNRPTNNGDMAETANRYVVPEGGSLRMTPWSERSCENFKKVKNNLISIFQSPD